MNEELEAQAPFSCILADPPWKFTDARVTAAPRKWQIVATSIADRSEIFDEYPMMDWPEIAKMPVGDLAGPRAHLWLWSLNSTMEQAYKVIRAWGFKPGVTTTWRKVSPYGKVLYGMGMYFRMNTEQLIFATRGKPALLPDKPWMGSTFDGERREHSRKPEIAYDMIEHVSPGPRLEIFARHRREGWTSWGNELRGQR